MFPDNSQPLSLCVALWIAAFVVAAVVAVLLLGAAQGKL